MTRSRHRSNIGNRQQVLLQKLVALVSREDAGGGADGADATGAQRAGEFEAVARIEAAEQAADEAGVEGVAPAGAVHVFHGKRAGPQPSAWPDERGCYMILGKLQTI